MEEIIPPLRPEVVVETRVEGGASLFDPVFGARVRLDERGALLAAALDKPQTLEQLADRLNADPAVLAGILGSFQRYHLLESEPARAAVESVVAIEENVAAPADSVPLLIRADARFSCTMCGSCCGGHTVGPVMDDVIEGLKPMMDALTKKTGSEKGLFYVLPPELSGSREGPTVMCHSSGGSCVFLADDAKCMIHADYGAEKKPRACRLFPYQFVATPDGVAVTISEECRGFGDARKGKALREDEASIRRLLNLVPTRQSLPKRLRLGPSAEITWAAYQTLEAGLHDDVDQAQHPTSALLAMRSRVIGAGVDVTDAGRDVPTLQRDLRQFCTALADFTGQLESQIGEASEDLVIHVGSLTQIGGALKALRDNLPRAIQPLKRDPHALFVDVMHHRLMSKALIENGTIADQFARLAFGWLLARSLMIQRAREVKRRHLATQDVMDGIVLASFVLRNEVLGDAIAPFTDAIRSLFFERLDALVDHADALPDPDTRAELCRF